MPLSLRPVRTPRIPQARAPRRRTAITGVLALVAGLLTATVAAAPPAVAADPTFSQVTLAKGVPEVGEPMSIAVLPDRSVLHTARNGTLRITDAAGNTKVSATIPVYSSDEEGLQGVAIDPGFATNRFVFLYYSPVLPDGAPGVTRLSRFVLGNDGTLDLNSEVTVLEVAATRGICCHVGGDIDFDADGNLFLSTGDDTNPFSSDGSTPIDERSGREAYDAQRTSANTNDLRGKLLRIKVNANGTYSIPAGNLFAPGTAKTRPEIYAMGFRNPFRMGVDKATGIVYLGEYGPDGGPADRGPTGQVEFNRVTAPGNYGWPYCTGNNEAYRDYTFPDGPIGAAFDCANGPTNNSPNNTGLTQLPPAKPAWITYGGANSPPEFGSGSESPMGGPVYRYDANNPSEIKFPQSYDGKFFAGEFGRKWIKTITVNADGTPGAIESFPWTGTQVMDMEFGPDGALYVLDYGDGGYFTGNERSALYRIEYVTGNRAPTAVASGTPTSGGVPLTVQFTGDTSTDPDGDTLTYAWDFDNNGTTDSTAANPTHTYTTAGTYSAKLTVTDPDGRSGSTNVAISAGNTAPTVTFTSPVNGQVFTFGDTVSYSISVTDPEDASIDCSRVSVTYGVGHDSHGHAETTKTGCSGTITTSADGEHDADANIYGSWSATYTDDSGLETTTSAVTQPKTRQAEHYSTMEGVQQVAKGVARGGKTVGYTNNGDWIRFTPYNLTGVTSFSARVSSGTSGGTLEVRAGSPTGTLAGSVDVAGTGGWETFTDVTGTITNPGGTTALYLVFKGAGTGYLFDVDEFTFTKSASSTPVDLTPGSTATASSTENANYAASNAIDGNTATRWSSQFSDPQSITVDLGEAHSVTGVKLNWEYAHGTAYSIQTSADGSTWRTASYSTTTGDGGIDDITFTTAAADTRYVRLTGTTRGTPWGYSLWEFQVYGN
jgi:glucose/arabinose dehydrogenase